MTSFEMRDLMMIIIIIKISVVGGDGRWSIRDVGRVKKVRSQGKHNQYVKGEIVKTVK